ncbi:MAG: CobW family GTP-binding protein, partial [Muribaculaceae bacterium]
MSSEKITPVLLLTGYLGSGKTTLLNRILNNTENIRFAVIVNDLGEVNIDAELIQKGGVVGNNNSDDLVALQNGCICCTLRTDLIEQLSELVTAGTFDYIVIEASGICEPAPIAQTICMMPRMDPKYTEHGTPRLDCICTVVDALRLKAEFDCGDALAMEIPEGEENIESLIIDQIEFCNIILLNKIDEVSADEARQIRSIIRAIQPKAKIIDTNYCDVPLGEILNTGAFNFEKVATSATWVRELEDIHDEDDHHGEHH